MALKGKSAFVMSEQTLACVEAIRAVNGEMSYAAISAIVGFPVSGASGPLLSARRHLESQEGIVFETVRGEGIRRLDDSAKVGSTARHARQIGRAARRGLRRIGTVANFAGLSNKDQLQATLRATQFEFAKKAVLSKKVLEPPAVSGSKLDVKALVAAATRR